MRLLIPAQLQRGDRLRTRTAVERALNSLAELGAEPEHQTMILLRQAEALTRSISVPDGARLVP
jgi:hypothetical protein